jgi:hypothetical protein
MASSPVPHRGSRPSSSGARSCNDGLIREDRESIGKGDGNPGLALALLKKGLREKNLPDRSPLPPRREKKYADLEPDGGNPSVVRYSIMMEKA